MRSAAKNNLAEYEKHKTEHVPFLELSFRASACHMPLTPPRAAPVQSGSAHLSQRDQRHSPFNYTDCTVNNEGVGFWDITSKGSHLRSMCECLPVFVVAPREPDCQLSNRLLEMPAG